MIRFAFCLLGRKSPLLSTMSLRPLSTVVIRLKFQALGLRWGNSIKVESKLLVLSILLYI